MRNPLTASKIGDEAATKPPFCSKAGLKRGPWTPEEDELLANCIRREGEGRWRTLPTRAGLHRCGKSCRLRWVNYLRPSVKRGQIAPDEEDLILRLHRLLGNRWSLIAGRIPGRTDNEIKNYWNTHLSKKLINQGIDPRTHKPLNANFHINTPSSSSKPNPNPISIKQNPNPNPNHTPNPNPNPSPNPKPNPNPNLLVEADTSDSSGSMMTMMMNKGIKQYDTDEMIGGPCSTAAGDDGMDFTQHSGGSGLDDDADMDMDMDMHINISYFPDDVFSSFLNSLINEDDDGLDHNSLLAPAASDPLLASAAMSGTGWDASSSIMYNQNQNI